MKLDRHYDALTTDERFALTIEAMARMDVVEIDRLQGAMEQHTYRMSDATYWRKLQMLTVLALRHAYLRKKITSRILAAFAVMTLGESSEERDKKLQGALGLLVGKMRAIDEAWRGFCESIGIDPDKALRSANIEPDNEIDDLFPMEGITAEPNQALCDELTDIYAGLWGKAAFVGH